MPELGLKEHCRPIRHDIDKMFANIILPLGRILIGKHGISKKKVVDANRLMLKSTDLIKVIYVFC